MKGGRDAARPVLVRKGNSLGARGSAEVRAPGGLGGQVGGGRWAGGVEALTVDQRAEMANRADDSSPRPARTLPRRADGR